MILKTYLVCKRNNLSSGHLSPSRVFEFVVNKIRAAEVWVRQRNLQRKTDEFEMPPK